MAAAHAAALPGLRRRHAALRQAAAGVLRAWAAARDACGACAARGAAAPALALAGAPDWAAAAGTVALPGAPGGAPREPLALAAGAAVRQAADLCHRRVRVGAAAEGMVEGMVDVAVAGAPYRLPGGAQFVATRLGVGVAPRLLRTLGCPDFHWSLVVADPPWANKSVARGRQYATMEDNAPLLALPVPLLLRRGGLLAIWVTHRPAHMAFILEELLPNWGLAHAATWYWLKLSPEGAPVVAWDNPQRRPYELLVLARNGATPPEGPPSPPLDFVFASVPSRLHSQKPPLWPLLAPFLPPDASPASVLELFARNLLAGGGTSVGDQVLQHQHAALFADFA